MDDVFDVVAVLFVVPVFAVVAAAVAVVVAVEGAWFGGIKPEEEEEAQDCGCGLEEEVEARDGGVGLEEAEETAARVCKWPKVRSSL